MIDKEDLTEVLEDCEALLADGFDQALIGYAEQPGGNLLALYDRNLCIKVLMNRDKMTKEDAVEFFEFNVIGSYVGDRAPMFATIMDQ